MLERRVGFVCKLPVTIEAYLHKPTPTNLQIEECNSSIHYSLTSAECLMKILSIDSDEEIIAGLTRILTTQQHIVDAVRDGEMGWTYATTFEYDAILLEIALPKLDGITLCKRMRGAGYKLPIMFLTAQDSIEAKVQGLDAGADDYLVKPFDRNELMARMRALFRRSRECEPQLLSWGDLSIDPSICEVIYDGRILDLTTKEYHLLELFVRNSYQVFSSEEIIDRLWSSDDFPAVATVRSHLRRLRHKLQAAGAPSDVIDTIHGRGYYLKSPQSDLMPDLTLTPELITTLQQTESEIFTRSQLLFVDLDPSLTTSLSELAAKYDIHTLNFANLTAASTYLATILDSPLDRQAATVVLVNLTTDWQSTAPIEFLHKIEQQLPQWTVLVIAAQDRWQDRLAVVRNHGHYLCIAGLSIDRLFTAVTSLIHQPTAPIKIMVVDDDLDWLRTLPKLLQPWRLKVTTLADPQQFGLVLQSVQPDALILGAKLPEISGLELCQVIRQDPLWRHLPVLLLSASKDPAPAEVFCCGVDDYLERPIEASILARRILNRLARQKYRSRY